MPASQPVAAVEATAKVVIHHATFSPDRAWQDILSQSKSEVRDHLVCRSERHGDATVAFVSLSDLPRETLVPLVNVVASAFAQTCRSQWKVEAEQAYTEAQDKLHSAERLAVEADSRLEVVAAAAERGSGCPKHANRRGLGRNHRESAMD